MEREEEGREGSGGIGEMGEGGEEIEEVRMGWDGGRKEMVGEEQGGMRRWERVESEDEKERKNWKQRKR